MRTRGSQLSRGPLLGLAAIALLLTACSGAEEPDTPLRQLTVGECVDFGAAVASDDGTVGGEGTSALPQVDCAQEHDGEVYAVSESRLDGFDEDALIAEADELCYAEFEGYVGTPYGDSTLYYSIVYPTGSTWNQGDRMLACVLVAETRSTGSAAGSGL